MAVLGMTGVANANSYTETYDPLDTLLDANGTNGAPTFISWTFNITDNPGWSNSGQVFNNGSINLVVADDGGSGDGSEFATFTVDLVDLVTTAIINSAVWGNPITVTASHFNDGTIDWKLTATTGDFYFKSAVLNVTSSVGTAPIPEPSTFLLLGAGLIGVGLARTRINR